MRLLCNFGDHMIYLVTKKQYHGHFDKNLCVFKLKEIDNVQAKKLMAATPLVTVVLLSLSFIENVLTMTNGCLFGNISLPTLPTALKLKDPNRIKSLRLFNSKLA